MQVLDRRSQRRKALGQYKVVRTHGGYMLCKGNLGQYQFYRTANGIAQLYAYYIFNHSMEAHEEEVFKHRRDLLADGVTYTSPHPKLAEAREVLKSLRGNERTDAERAWVYLMERRERYVRFTKYLLAKMPITGNYSEEH